MKKQNKTEEIEKKQERLGEGMKTKLKRERLGGRRNNIKKKRVNINKKELIRIFHGLGLSSQLSNCINPLHSII